MRIAVLGPLVTEPRALGPRERQVLAALVVRRPFAMSTEEIADLLWGDQRPTTWRQQVQSSVFRIRSAIGRGAVIADEVGYRLAVGDDELDVGQFRESIESARLHASRGAWRRAASSYRTALALWRDRPLPGLDDWAPARSWSAQLISDHDVAREGLVQARLEFEDADAVVSDAEQLVALSPLSENRWRLLALALHRAGRQAESLAALRAARVRLRDELGVSPGPEIAALEVAVLRRDPDLRVSTTGELTSVPPYRGLEPFRVEDADYFFGRGAVVAEALRLLDVSSVVVLAGPTGSGKSSIAIAGVVPVLRRRGHSVEIAGPSAGWTAQPAGGRGPLYLVLDQFEELLAAPDDVRASIAERIGSTVDAGGRVLLTVRSDFLDRVIEIPGLAPRLSGGVLLVPPMTDAELREAIIEPARLAGYSIEAGLVELIMKDAAGRPAVLPHVSHALRETFARREGDTLTVAGYIETGGISGAIASSADQAFHALHGEQRENCRRILVRLVTLGSEGEPVRRRVHSETLAASVTEGEVVERLASARLVTIESGYLTIVHESVATAWPRLHGWLEEDARGARVRLALETSAGVWAADGRRPEDLWRGSRLAAALELEEDTALTPTAIERDFLAASRDQEGSTARAIREQARRDRRQNTRLRGALAAIAGLLVLAVISGLLLAGANSRSEAAAENAHIESLVATSLALRTSDRSLAALLAAEVVRRWPDDPRGRVALMGTLTASDGILFRHSWASDWVAGAVLPEVSEMVVDDGTELGLYRISDGVRVRVLASGLDPGNSGIPAAVAVAPDESSVVVATYDRREDGSCCTTRLVVAELGEAGAEPIQVTLDDTSWGDIAISPTTAYVTDFSAPYLVAVDLASGVQSTIDLDAPGPVDVLDDGRIVIGGAEHITALDPVTFDVVGRVELPEGFAEADLTSVAGGQVISAGATGLASVDVDSQSVSWLEPAPPTTTQDCARLAVAVSVGQLYCSGSRGLEVRSLESGALIERVGDLPGVPAVDDAGTRLVVFGNTRPVVTVRALDGTGPVSRIIGAGRMLTGGFEPGGNRLITAERPGDGVPLRDLEGWAVWDPETDTPAYPPDADEAWLSWAASGVVDSWDGIDGHPDFLRTISDGRKVQLSILMPENVLASSRGDLAYAIVSGGVQPIDPTTGASVGPFLAVEDPVSIVTDTADSKTVVVTAFNELQTRSEVIVFDRESGSVVARGLDGAFGATPTSDARIVSSTSSEVLVSTLPDLRAVAALPSLDGASSLRPQLSADNSTLLIPGLDQQAVLYDLEVGAALGEGIQGAAGADWAVAYLRDDGLALAVSVPEGIAVWDLAPDRMFEAVCRLAGRSITPTEWASHVSADEPVVQACGPRE